MQVDFGEVLRAVGNEKPLGAWDLSKAVTLKWGDGDVWSCVVQIPVGQAIRFKLVKVAGEVADWAGGTDRQLTVSGGRWMPLPAL